jgi:hypothetical protein
VDSQLNPEKQQMCKNSFNVTYIKMLCHIFVNRAADNLLRAVLNWKSVLIGWNANGGKNKTLNGNISHSKKQLPRSHNRWQDSNVLPMFSRILHLKSSFALGC